ncbi:serine hydrolase domain-containing protein [Desulfomarina sp.]
MSIFIAVISIGFSLIFPLTGIAAPPPAHSPEAAQADYRTMHREISRLIRKQMKKNDIVGLSIAVVDNQNTVWAEGFGWADRKNKIRATPQTVYRVGSITKLFTATAAMLLAEQNRLDIDQPLRVILPQFHMKSRFKRTGDITPRNIMTHHSGLPTDYNRGMWEEEPEDFTRLVDLLHDEYTAYPPDTIFCYSNIGMTLLGHAIQEVSRQPYSEFIDRKLLMPLEMFHSSIFKTLQNDPQSSKGYSDDEEAKILPLRDLPAGGLNSTVLDLANFTKMVFAGGRFGRQQIIQKETLDKMLHFQDGNAPFDLGRQMGLGWFLKQQNHENRGLKAMHGGDTFLFHSMLITLPRYQLAVIVLANSESSANSVHDIAEDALNMALEIKTGIKRKATEKLAETELPTPPEDLISFPGYYSTSNTTVKITRDGDQLKLINDDDTLNLVLREDGQYHLQYKLLGLFPIDLEGLDELGITHTEINGREVLLARFRGQKIYFGEKIVISPIPASWKSRTGSYRMLHPTPGLQFKNMQLKIEHGFLALHYTIKLPLGEEAE